MDTYPVDPTAGETPAPTPTVTGDHLARSLLTPGILLGGLDELIDKAMLIPNVDGVSVTVQFRGRPFVLVHSNSGAQMFAEHEVRHRDGPGLRSLRTGRVIKAGHGQIQARWPAMTRVADNAGFRAVHAEPLRLPPHQGGVLTLYSAGQDPINPPPGLLDPVRDSITTAVAEYCAANPHQDHAGRLHKELQNRQLRGHATGILMARHHLNLEQASRLLQERATAGNKQVNATARAVLREHLARTQHGAGY